MSKLTKFNSSFESMFEDIFGQPLLPYLRTLEYPISESRMPSMDLVKREGGYDIKLAIPGFKKDDISISVEGNILTVSGESSMKEENAKYLRKEISMAKFSRSVTLLENSDINNIRAQHEDGILTVSVPTGVENTNRVDVSID